MAKVFSTECVLNFKVLAMMYICWYFKYPLSMLLTLYEMYRDMALFAFRALSCCKKIKLTDTLFEKILSESKLLFSQILTNKSILLKIKQLKAYNPDNEEIPQEPTINLEVFSDDYKRFISEYLMENVQDIYADVVKISLSSEDIYAEYGIGE